MDEMDSFFSPRDSCARDLRLCFGAHGVRRSRPALSEQERFERICRAVLHDLVFQRIILRVCVFIII